MNILCSVRYRRIYRRNCCRKSEYRKVNIEKRILLIVVYNSI
jgi:hypothetical protein